MGLPMYNIHNPTTVGAVAAGPTSAPSAALEPEEPLSLDELNSQKVKLESELSSLGSVLDSHGVNMRTGLTTLDGFPRADVDVAQIRTTRARIIHLRNDYKALLTRIEKAVHARFAALAADPTTNSASLSASRAATPSCLGDLTSPAFALVNTVIPSSPAADAGLRPNDKIYEFGDANWLDHEKLARVAQVVARNEGQPIVVQILRLTGQVETHQTLTLIPRRDWGGRGLLGCHLLPC